MVNRLSESTSPYLLQHRDNPVDWWEWSDEAFEEARRRDVPVLLSVGYAACHWCHVMAHESFEDPDTAHLMNEKFVNVKVDREERPDVDSVYMEAVQAMTGRGGWPMTVWMDHSGRPFFAGTYFPKSPRHGMASFTQVIESIGNAWNDRREEVAEQAQRLVDAISREIPAGPELDGDLIRHGMRGIASSFDPINGGFGNAPKFPQQPVLDFLLRVWREDWATGAEPMLNKTLERMANGGIYDHLGGGFARYSVDDRWLVPHFEKMLYDNAQLARLYLWAGVEFDRADFIDVARSTLNYMSRDLRHADGGFFSSEDADSEGVEGKFYVWSESEIDRLLGSSSDRFKAAYRVTPQGNFEGANILHAVGDTSNLGEARETLLAARALRIRPGLDDKVITSWNGLAIRAFAEAGAVLDDPSLLKQATAAAEFVLNRLVRDGEVMRSWRAGRVSGTGFLDDYAALAVGLFTLYAATGELRWYREAMRLVECFQRFDKPDGGYFTTPDDGEVLVKRPSDFTDNPAPSGSALAAEALTIASLYSGDHALKDRAQRALAAVGTLAGRYPSMVGHHLAVAASHHKELALVGPDWREMAAVYWSKYRPGVVVAGSREETNEVPLLADRDGGGRTLAYVCEDFVCELPTADLAEISRLLDRQT